MYSSDIYIQTYSNKFNKHDETYIAICKIS